MQITDPVADMLTRMRNANSAKHETVDVPASNLKKAIAQILLDEGYIKAYSIVDNGNQGPYQNSNFHAGKLLLLWYLFCQNSTLTTKVYKQ